MHVHDDLELLRDHLARLVATGALKSGLEAHTRSVVDLIDHVIERVSSSPPEVLTEVRHQVWVAHQHLSGAVSKEAPFEVVFALSHALRDWTPEPGYAPFVTTALIDEPNFYFSQSLKWERMGALFPDFPMPNPARALVQVSLPRLYRTRPLDCVPLYHELAHHVDHTHSVVETMMLLSPLAAGKPPTDLHLNYMREHFADLFAACYCGDALRESIVQLAPNLAQTSTHPARAHRLAIVDDFLAGRQHRMIDEFNDALTRRGLPTLTQRFSPVDVAPAFDDVRPCSLADVRELHGLFGSARRYLDEALESPRPPWVDMPRRRVVRIINDLVEKSIRNMDVRERWGRASTGS